MPMKHREAAVAVAAAAAQKSGRNQWPRLRRTIVMEEAEAEVVQMAAEAAVASLQAAVAAAVMQLVTSSWNSLQRHLYW